MNKNNKLLNTLATEQDILDRIVANLDTESLKSLSNSCRRSRDIFELFDVWKKRVRLWSLHNKIEYDWAKRTNSFNYQLILEKLKRLEKTWSTGPITCNYLSVKEEVKDVFMDETNIAVLLGFTGIHVFSRHIFKEPPLKVKAHDLHKVGLTPNFLLGAGQHR